MVEVLPHSAEFPNEEAYVTSLLHFITSCDLFQMLCGGVHILDFFTREPDVYSTLLPETWRGWFRQVEVEDVLDLLLRKDLNSALMDSKKPPQALLDYIGEIRRHGLTRDFKSRERRNISSPGHRVDKLARNVAVGMKPKKKHEVENFAKYIDELASENGITHLVDFGSGQGYLGRALASKPYNRHVIAIEGREGNIQGARRMDARMGKKSRIPGHEQQYPNLNTDKMGESVISGSGFCSRRVLQNDTELEVNKIPDGSNKGSLHYIQHRIEDGNLSFMADWLSYLQARTNASRENAVSDHIHGLGALQACGGEICSKLGRLCCCTFCHSRVERHSDDDGRQNSEIHVEKGPREQLYHPRMDSSLLDVKPLLCKHNLNQNDKPKVMVLSLHSCGNLIHHGLRSLLLNDFVVVVALVGCCYNLVTERLGPPTFKVPSLRDFNPRLVREQLAYDPDGFPMSEHLANYEYKHGRGIRFNITARMMAVQAPQNWTSEDSDAFMTRHYFRALLQRIFLERSVVRQTTERPVEVGGEDVTKFKGTDPIIIGSLRKACYSSFRAYVRGAVAKLAADPIRGGHIQAKMNSLTDEEIDRYERAYHERKKELSIVWSLMAFSAGLVEAAIVVDRWLFLKEQKEVQTCWVETVFDYKQSPRNLVVVGIKRGQR